MPPSPVVMCLPCCRLKQPIGAERADSLPAVRGAERLRAVLDHRDAGCAHSSMIGVHVARVAEQVGDDDRLGARRDLAAMVSAVTL